MPPYAPPSTGATAATDEGRQVVASRHREHDEFCTRWRWLQDSLEGGDRYRNAEYGSESYTLRWNRTDNAGNVIPDSRPIHVTKHNLVRHPHEYPTPPGMGGVGEWDSLDQVETGSEYAFRKAMTPVPNFVAEAIGQHLSRIYAREVNRTADGLPADLKAKLQGWWDDVDGSGQEIDDWMRETIAPLFLAQGLIDLAFDHPEAPEGMTPRSRAEEREYGIDRCVASYILPQNVPNWKLSPNKEYRWVNIIEYDDDGNEQYRRWDDAGWVHYDADGERLGEGKHPYGCVPIVRAYDRKNPRCDNIGNPDPYWRIAELMRAYYNVDSELTLANSLAAHPQLSGPEDYCSGNQTIPTGPGNVLPKKKTPGGGYEGWDWLCAPNDAADRLRTKLQDYRDEVDRAACLTKPAGQTAGATVSQSGISKMLDQVTGNDLLASKAKSLQQLETWAAQYALIVLSNGEVTPEELDAVKIVYPTEFDLFTAQDLALILQDLQGIAALAGALPFAETELIVRMVLSSLPGLSEEGQKEIRKEVETYVDAYAKTRGAEAVANPPEPPPLQPPPPGSGQPGDGAGARPMAEPGMGTMPETTQDMAA
jgi:hypothetical protein